ncbi:hypothetical protein MPLSOD_360001 [Mesorhizobium sp. SOD10]|nr:hypothetical protein MPLSOD_360001 [Mesorhizobium sp. SOD10]
MNTVAIPWRIHSVTDAIGAQRCRIPQTLQRLSVTEWIPGSARVASLLAPPWNDDLKRAPVNLQGRHPALTGPS